MTRADSARTPGHVLVGGGGDAALSGTQKLTIITAAPLALIMVLLCVSLAKELRTDPHQTQEPQRLVSGKWSYRTTCHSRGLSRDYLASVSSAPIRCTPVRRSSSPRA